MCQSPAAQTPAALDVCRLKMLRGLLRQREVFMHELSINVNDILLNTFLSDGCCYPGDLPWWRIGSPRGCWQRFTPPASPGVLNLTLVYL